MSARVRINQQGRIVIPAECRAAAGLKPGDDLLIEAVGEGELRLRTRRQALKEAQAIVAYRKANGSFQDFEAVKRVPDIDVKKLDEHKDAVAF